MSPNFLCWQKPLPPLSSTDEERQLQLALALSKEEHEKVSVPHGPGHSSLALGLLLGTLQPETPPCSGTHSAFTALAFLLRVLLVGSAPEEPSAWMLGLFCNMVAVPVLVFLLVKVLAAGLLSSHAPSLVLAGGEGLARGELHDAETNGGDFPEQGGRRRKDKEKPGTALATQPALGLQSDL